MIFICNLFIYSLFNDWLALYDYYNWENRYNIYYENSCSKKSCFEDSYDVKK